MNGPAQKVKAPLFILSELIWTGDLTISAPLVSVSHPSGNVCSTRLSHGTNYY